jgi:mannose-1-phosphate guanylyltransferase/phosphomannomutase
MRRAIEAVQPYRNELIDGVKVFINGGWVLLMPDPDEATFHIWVEATSKVDARSLMKEYADKLKQWQS